MSDSQFSSFSNFDETEFPGFQQMNGGPTPSRFFSPARVVVPPVVPPVPVVPCFKEDTKILCLNKEFQEEYIKIQDLRRGDIVKSYLHGYRKIEYIGKNDMYNDPSNLLS